MKKRQTASPFGFSLVFLLHLLCLGACSTAEVSSDKNSNNKDTVNSCEEFRKKAIEKKEPLPEITSVTPREGKRSGQTDITISGKRFQAGATVLLGNSPCVGVIVQDSKTIKCVSPKHKPELVDVFVYNPDNSCAYLPEGFAFFPAVIIHPTSKILAVGNVFPFEVTSGKAPYLFTILSGEGSIDKDTGEFTAPAQPGTTVIQVTDTTGTRAEAMVTTTPTVSIFGPKHIIPGNRYSFSATGGVPPYQFGVTTGNSQIDPNTGSFDAQGVPEDTVTVRVEDAQKNSAEMTLTLQAPFSFDPPVTTIGLSNTIVAKGGLPPVTLSIIAGGGTILEDGLTFKAPEVPGTTVLRVVDAQGNQMERSITVMPKLVIFPYSKTLLIGDTVHFSSTGGVLPIKYSLVNGNGKLDEKSGKFRAPDMPGESTIRVTDSMGNTAEANVAYTTEGLVLQKIVSGYSHSCAMYKAGVKCWGSNADGQLGNGTFKRKYLPTQVDGLKEGVIALAAGFHHTCALVRGGIIKCWGSNTYGQLGNNSTVTSNVPVRVYGISGGAQAVVAGEYHTCAIVNGSALCWGDNRRGQLGNDTQTPSSIPIQVKGLSQFVQGIAAGGYHSCAIAGGGLKCWGYNYTGQIGDGTFQPRFTPMQVTGLESGVQSVAAGGFHTCALVQDKMKCWGYNGSGQLGTGNTKNSHTPVDVAGLPEKPSYLALGNYHTCALSGGKTLCWGFNSETQIGATQKEPHFSTPIVAAWAQESPDGLSAGVNQTCTIKGENALCWGSNGLGDKYSFHPIELKDFEASFPETQ